MKRGAPNVISSSPASPRSLRPRWKVLLWVTGVLVCAVALWVAMTAAYIAGHVGDNARRADAIPTARQGGHRDGAPGRLPRRCQRVAAPASPARSGR